VITASTPPVISRLPTLPVTIHSLDWGAAEVASGARDAVRDGRLVWNVCACGNDDEGNSLEQTRVLTHRDLAPRADGQRSPGEHRSHGVR
jgi:hypothetical protein